VHGTIRGTKRNAKSSKLSIEKGLKKKEDYTTLSTTKSITGNVKSSKRSIELKPKKIKGVIIPYTTSETERH
jgi:hypothetical protein